MSGPLPLLLARWCVVASVIAGVLCALTGFGGVRLVQPVARGPAAASGGEWYPCLGRRCGCPSAEVCRTSCRCPKPPGWASRSVQGAKARGEGGRGAIVEGTGGAVAASSGQSGGGGCCGSTGHTAGEANAGERADATAGLTAELLMEVASGLEGDSTAGGLSTGGAAAGSDPDGADGTWGAGDGSDAAGWRWVIRSAACHGSSPEAVFATVVWVAGELAVAEVLTPPLTGQSPVPATTTPASMDGRPEPPPPRV
ncbi:MAG: hypothetical protein ACK4PI_01570 [Tepidisphaerales bacterium]